MDIKAFFENLKDKIISLYQTIVDYCRDNKKNAILFASLGACIILLIILLACLPHKKKDKNPAQKEILVTEEFLIPDGPELHQDYNISRRTQEKWSDEQADTWFQIPGQKDIDSLEKANDNIINEITGAAP